MEFERGSGFDLAAYDPCPGCGVRDVDMRDPITKIPHTPPPLIAVGWQCQACLAIGHKEKELSEGYNGEPPPGMRVRLMPYVPSEDEDED